MGVCQHLWRDVLAARGKREGVVTKTKEARIVWTTAIAERERQRLCWGRLATLSEWRDGYVWHMASTSRASHRV